MDKCRISGNTTLRIILSLRDIFTAITLSLSDTYN